MERAQSVIFLRTMWSVTIARKWLKDHKYKYKGKVDTTTNFYRFRQFPPKSGRKYRTKALAVLGVKLVLQY